MTTTTLTAPCAVPPSPRRPRPRRYLMCRPEHYGVEYVINPWMRPEVPVDRDLALAQWDTLRRTYLDLGHTVDEIDPLPGLPDMVFAANGGLVVNGVAVPARFKHAERAGEGPAYRDWFAAHGLRLADTTHVNEGEGDLLPVGGVVLAGTGFRTVPAAHRDVEAAIGVPVMTLRLVDPRFYHLDTALAVLDDETVAYYPEAFSRRSRALLRRLFPDAVLADERDAQAFGLNAVSDGANVVLSAGAPRLAAALRDRGFRPVPVDVSELMKAGGGPKCCTLELRESR